MVELMPFQRSDFDRLIGWVPDAEAMMLWTGLVFQFPLTKAQLEKHLVYAETHPQHRKIWNAVYQDEVVGHIELNNIWDHDRRATLNRVMISPLARGQGFGKQMVRCVLQYGFEELGLHRIDLGAWEHNTQALRCYEACGFVREGVQRESRRVGDGWWSNVQMGILEQEWRAHGEG